ncbi:MAG: bifunctional demethylmenaquinone methyltransferase/2-methoxy-6-polyprenyl-1,4-benzoquinol methylase UbiE [Candidatus Methanoperedens sp.]|nr:bifunctional demethylmenaquinone methyltransferase/2-methoxy-6-polyprenyl-1,4-benzoquinol methylase UbiE [Candidatus Methanoperedens sp.]
MQKKEKIRKMFAGISRRYDFLNCLLSLGQDRKWRRFAVSKLPGGLVLDICSGTGDVAIEASGKNDVVASDFCYEMLELCSSKISKKGILNASCIRNDAENLSFRDGTFDGAVVAFGIRNVADIRKALSEMHRVVKKGGKVVVLEFSRPTNPFFRAGYYFYFRKILPVIGRIVSKKDGAYSYLPSSVMAFPQRDGFSKLMEGSGFSDIKYHDLTFGIVTVYTGSK